MALLDPLSKDIKEKTNLKNRKQIKLKELHFKLVSHPVCSADMVPTDYYMFGSNEEVIPKVKF